MGLGVANPGGMAGYGVGAAQKPRIADMKRGGGNPAMSVAGEAIYNVNVAA